MDFEVELIRQTTLTPKFNHLSDVIKMQILKRNLYHLGNCLKFFDNLRKLYFPYCQKLAGKLIEVLQPFFQLYCSVWNDILRNI